MTDGDRIGVVSDPNPDLTLKTMEQQHISKVLETMGGNKRQAARALGIARATLDRKLAS